MSILNLDEKRPEPNQAIEPGVHDKRPSSHALTTPEIQATTAGSLGTGETESPQPIQGRWSKNDLWLPTIIVGTFVAWFYYYLVHVRPVINRFVFRYISSYPAGIHVIPMVGVPVLAILAWEAMGPRGPRRGNNPE